MIDRTITFRLIGAGIMVLSAAVILPLILDGERPPELDIQVQVSEPPAFPVIKIAPVQPVKSLPVASTEKSAQDITLIPTPKAAKDVEPNSVVSKVTLPTPTVSAPKKTVEAKAPAKTTERWVVQIATFKSKDNATRLVDKLKAAKYDAYSITTNSLYKVYVGPEFKRDTSEKVRDEIKSKFKLAGFVTKFSVN
ncbi:SPOR domain-containing protein [Marinomonas colpomeniae]|nr:SPOR domain-containing protein [Marinomonas colpomeniae]